MRNIFTIIIAAIIGLLAGLILYPIMVTDNKSAMLGPTTDLSDSETSLPVVMTKSDPNCERWSTEAAVMRRDIDKELKALKTLIDDIQLVGNEQSDSPVDKLGPDFDNAASPAFDRVVSLIDSAVAFGQWTETESSQFQEEMPGLSPAETAEAYRRLSVAINEGRIVPDMENFPF